MKILKDKTCPKCGEPDGLTICATVGAINCSCCFEFIRVLTKEERKILAKNIAKAIKRAEKLKLKPCASIIINRKSPKEASK